MATVSRWLPVSSFFSTPKGYNNIFSAPLQMPNISSLRFLRVGLHLGQSIPFSCGTGCEIPFCLLSAWLWWALSGLVISFLHFFKATRCPQIQKFASSAFSVVVNAVCQLPLDLFDIFRRALNILCSLFQPIFYFAKIINLASASLAFSQPSSLQMRVKFFLMRRATSMPL